MNKKAQFISLGILVAMIILFAFYIVVEDSSGKRKVSIKYVGDTSTKIAYNLESNNLDCNFDAIIIHKNNIKYFENKNKVILENYIIDKNCN